MIDRDERRVVQKKREKEGRGEKAGRAGARGKENRAPERGERERKGGGKVVGDVAGVAPGGCRLPSRMPLMLRLMDAQVDV